MDPSLNFTNHLLESLATLAPEDQARALNELIAWPLKTLSIFRILELRCTIKAKFDPSLPAVANALTLIDGQIALREIAGNDRWR